MRPGAPLLLAALLSAAAAARAEPAMVVVTAGPQVGFRKVTWRDRVSPTLAGYQSGTLALIGISAEVYLASGKGLPVVSDVGLVGSVARSLRAHDEGPPGTTGFESLWHVWDLGGRWRAVFGGTEWGGVSLRYGSTGWSFNGDRPQGSLLPSGTLQYWRPGLDLRLPIGPVALALSGGFRAVVVPDAIGRAFPRRTGGGVDAELSATLDLGPRLQLRLAGRYARFYSSLNPMPGDRWIAGGVLDEQAVLDLTCAARL